jgi:hypothetical protein
MELPAGWLWLVYGHTLPPWFRISGAICEAMLDRPQNTQIKRPPAGHLEQARDHSILSSLNCSFRFDEALHPDRQMFLFVNPS